MPLATNSSQNNTTNLGLPLILQNQLSKEITHNEAIIVLDSILNNGLKSLTGVNSELSLTDPEVNSCYVVGEEPSGEFTESQAGDIAVFTQNGWRFFTPNDGFISWVLDVELLYVFTRGAWISINESESSFFRISNASTGDMLQYDGVKFSNVSTIDNFESFGIGTASSNENKLSVSSSNVLFTHDEDDCRLKINKLSQDKVASVVFQDNWSGRAEFGIVGSDKFSLKVSDDGGNWINALEIDNATGNSSFGKDSLVNGLLSASKMRCDGDLIGTAFSDNKMGNFVVNGSFSVWQRGETIEAMEQEPYCADLWSLHRKEASGYINQELVATVSNAELVGRGNSTKVSRVVGSSRNSDIAFAHSLDSWRVKTLRSRDVVFGAKVKLGENFSGGDGMMVAKLSYTTNQNAVDDYFGSDVDFTELSSVIVPNDRNIWHRVSFNTVIPTDAKRLVVSFCVGGVSSPPAFVDDYFEVSEIQLEAGSELRCYVPDDYESTLSECRGKYQRIENKSSENLFLCQGICFNESEVRCVVEMEKSLSGKEADDVVLSVLNNISDLIFLSSGKASGVSVSSITQTNIASKYINLTLTVPNAQVGEVGFIALRENSVIEIQ